MWKQTETAAAAARGAAITTTRAPRSNTPIRLADAALQKMVREGTITQAEAIRYARDPETVQSMRRY